MIESGGSKLKEGLLKWGVPLAGLVTGVIFGDMGVSKFLTDIIPAGVGPKALGILVSALYAVAGVMVYSHFGVIGHFVGAWLIGVAIATVYEALAGKKLPLPGIVQGG